MINYYNDDVLNNDISKERYVILNLLGYPNDHVSLRWWLGHGSNTWNTSLYSRLRGHCETTNNSLPQALERMRSGSINISRGQVLIEKYKELTDTIEQIRNMRGLDLINAVFPESIGECKDLRTAALRVIDKNISAKELLDRLREEIIHPDIPFQRNDVSIMSLHKAKGLEAALVIISACVEGLIPSADREKTIVEQRRELEENRRLFYVGITRTKKALILSSFLSMKIGSAEQMKIQYKKSGNLAKVQASRFIGELGPNCPTPITGDNFIQERCTHG